MPSPGQLGRFLRLVAAQTSVQCCRAFRHQPRVIPAPARLHAISHSRWQRADDAPAPCQSIYSFSIQAGAWNPSTHASAEARKYGFPTPRG